MRLKSHYQKKTLFGKTISIASPPKKETLVMLNASTDATEVALPKENTIWKGNFNRTSKNQPITTLKIIK